jgi:hypothetical protein
MGEKEGEEGRRQEEGEAKDPLQLYRVGTGGLQEEDSRDVPSSGSPW